MLRAIRRPSAFGKLPSALDFVRIHHDYPEAVQLDRWLTAGFARLQARSLAWPSEALRFLFVPGGTGSALLGALAASRDRAGRAFPLAIFAAFEPAADLAALPRACSSFLAQAEAVLARSAALSAPVLSAALTHLRLPAPRELRRAQEQLAHELAELRLDAFADALFAGAPAAALDAFECLGAAAARGSRELVFDCPVDPRRDGAIWSSLATLALGRAPSCLWNAQRLLLALGPLPERASLYWAAPGRKHPQLCAVAGSAAAPSPTRAVSGERTLAGLFTEIVAAAARTPGACAP